MFHSIMFLLLSASQYGPMQAHNDSLYIYNTYAASAKVFEAGTQANKWKTLSDSVNQVTASALMRLNKYNNESYAPVDELNKEGLGSALVFPKPGEMFEANVEPKADAKVEPSADTKVEPKAEEKETDNTSVEGKQVAFKVLDEQTHFLIGPNGKGRTPYVVMNYYAKGRILVRSEKLNPITLQPIQIVAEGPGLATSSN